MVYESYPWKQDLIRRKNLIKKYNIAERFDTNYDSTYTVIEKAIFYSAFIIRKLIDCGEKVSDEADNYQLSVAKIKPLKHIDVLNRFPNEDNFDWEHEQNIMAKGKDVCNWLIHSFLFFVRFDESETIDSFLVSSDYDKNKSLYRISLTDWFNYMEFIGTDDIVSLDMSYSEKSGERVYTRKERGIRTFRR